MQVTTMRSGGRGGWFTFILFVFMSHLYLIVGALCFALLSLYLSTGNLSNDYSLFDAAAVLRNNGGDDSQWMKSLIRHYEPLAVSSASDASSSRMIHTPPQPPRNTWKSPIAGDDPMLFLNIPKPVRVMEQYIEGHGVDALERELLASSSSSSSAPSNRTYALAFYSCPHSAGNRMHEFLNYAMWAVVTNRTLLYKYFDRKTCIKYAPKLGISLLHCEGANDVAECDAILSRAPWIASYDEWSDRLRLPEPKILPPQATDGKKFVAVDSQYGKHPVVVFPHSTISEEVLATKTIRERKLHAKGARRAAQRLFAHDTDFLFGMLQRYTFDFSERIKLAVPRGMMVEHAHSIAIHSRHNDERETGCNITQEVKCLKEVLKKRKKDRPCHVALMADRECTISSLQTWLADQDCQIFVAEHDAGKGTYAEHGPFAGGGYFQDLALASQVARHGVVGSWLHQNRWRSSSLLLLELVEFHKVMDAWRRGKDLKKVKRVQKCTLGGDEAKKALWQRLGFGI